MWVIYSLGATVLLAAMTLMFVPPGRAGVHPSVLLFYLLSCATVFSFGYLKFHGLSLGLPGGSLAWIVAAAVASFFGNLCALHAINAAPNPGYASAIEASKATIVVLLSVWLFASHFSMLKGIGTILCALGVALLSL